MRLRNLNILGTLLVLGTTVSAQAETRIIESRVPPPAGSTQTTTTYKVVGPNQVEYILDAPPQEIATITKTIEQTPNAVIRFEGETIEGARPMLRVSRWHRETQTTSDSAGNVTTEKVVTEERTTR